jgi:hypothetical protein
MKMENRTPLAQRCLLTVALIGFLAAFSATAATSLNPRVIPRPLTPNDIATYGLPASLEYSGGLYTVGIGTPLYLEAEVNIAISPASITSVTWALTSKPITSTATFTNSPLTPNVPVFLPSDKLTYQVAGRTLFRPDAWGEYTVTATIVTTNLTTNVSATFNAGFYLGVDECAGCHSGGQQGGGLTPPDVYPSWANTLHAAIFTQGIDGVLGAGYSQSCIKCHTTGYDTNSVTFGDDGFYSVAQQDGWTFPTNIANPTLAATNFASMPGNLQSLANITCENCHGPGSQHVLGVYTPSSAPNWPFVDVPLNAGACEQCHDDPPHHQYGTEWYVSSHAVTTTIPTTEAPATAQYCVRCHTAAGFINIVSNLSAGNGIVTDTNISYNSIDCQTCHEPHGLTVPTNDAHLIRVVASATFGDGTVITNGGEGNLCMVCHHSRNAATTNVTDWPIGIPAWAGASSPPSPYDFGPHDSPQGDMVEGTNAFTYGQSIPSSAHRISVTNSCVGCHMQTIAASDPGVLLSGGHTFEMSYNLVTNGVTNKIDQVGVCNQCHGGITTFNFPVEDYANVGQVLGVQTEVQILLNQLSTLLPNKSGVIDGSVKTSLSVTTNWTQAELMAAYNWQFVNNDGSMGVHNAPYATGILKASIANLTGVSVPGSLPDVWEQTYFGSLTNSLGAPDADPAGDGIPNWLKYSLGLNPMVAGLTLPNGVVYADGNALGGNTPTNTLEIYTAADVTFDTVQGTTYQIQETSSLSDGWQDVGYPIVATNTASVSYLTPTTGDLQQFFRVVSAPTQ